MRVSAEASTEIIMYQCTLHREGKNTILVADKWKNLRKLILKKAKPDSLWGMLYKDDQIWDYLFFPICVLPARKPGQFEVSEKMRRYRRRAPRDAFLAR
jgi:hypothetical protein